MKSAADKGAKGVTFRVNFGAVRSRPLAGHRIPHQGKQQSTGGFVQACGQPHHQHRPKTSKPWAGRCSLEQNTFFRVTPFLFPELFPRFEPAVNER